MEIKSVLSAGFGLPCRSDKDTENKGLTHLFYMHFQNLKKKNRLEEPHRLAGTPFGPPRTQEYLGQALTSRNSTNNDVKSYSSSRLTEIFHSKTKERAQHHLSQGDM